MKKLKQNFSLFLLILISVTIFTSCTVSPDATANKSQNPGDSSGVVSQEVKQNHIVTKAEILDSLRVVDSLPTVAIAQAAKTLEAKTKLDTLLVRAKRDSVFVANISPKDLKDSTKSARVQYLFANKSIKDAEINTAKANLASLSAVPDAIWKRKDNATAFVKKYITENLTETAIE